MFACCSKKVYIKLTLGPRPCHIRHKRTSLGPNYRASRVGRQMLRTTLTSRAGALLSSAKLTQRENPSSNIEQLGGQTPCKCRSLLPLANLQSKHPETRMVSSACMKSPHLRWNLKTKHTLKAEQKRKLAEKHEACRVAKNYSCPSLL